jgi:hypothetical protein
VCVCGVCACVRSCINNIYITEYSNIDTIPTYIRVLQYYDYYKREREREREGYKNRDSLTTSI